MAAKYWETVHKHNFSWDKVVHGYWRRYPNPNSQHVFGEDFMNVEVTEDGCLRTKRILMKTNKLPSWGQHFFNARRVPLIEESIVNPKTRMMTTYTRNIGLRLFMGTTERVTFKACESDPDVTIVEKQVWIESDIVGFRSAIKSFGVDRFKKNCILATKGFDWVLSKMFAPNANVIEPNHEIKTSSADSVSNFHINNIANSRIVY